MSKSLHIAINSATLECPFHGLCKATATAFAPASVGNTAVAFDMMGFALHGAGDRVTVRAVDGEPEVLIESISGIVSELPMQAAKNTAGVALLAFARDHLPGIALRVSIGKGIPLASGMGGSAASAVATVVAANALLEKPLERRNLLKYALAGEVVASGSAHLDNVAPSLLGGIVLTVSTNECKVVNIPVPSNLHAVLVHPDMEISTAAARAVLEPDVSLHGHVEQIGYLGGFLAGCYRDDLDLIGRSLQDVLIEPQRAGLIPGFYDAKNAALDAGALGFSIAGAGPSVFAFARSNVGAEQIAQAIAQAFEQVGLAAFSLTGPINRNGASIVEAESPCGT